MLFIIQKLSNIQIAIWVNLDSLAILLVIIELALVKSAIFLDVNPHPLSFLTIHLSEVDLPIAFDQFELGTIKQPLDADVYLREEAIVCEILTKLVLLKRPNLMHSAMFFYGMNS